MFYYLIYKNEVWAERRESWNFELNSKQNNNSETPPGPIFLQVPLILRIWLVICGWKQKMWEFCERPSWAVFGFHHNLEVDAALLTTANVHRQNPCPASEKQAWAHSNISWWSFATGVNINGGGRPLIQGASPLYPGGFWIVYTVASSSFSPVSSETTND